jgi:hypothetical protein
LTFYRGAPQVGGFTTQSLDGRGDNALSRPVSNGKLPMSPELD